MFTVMLIVLIQFRIIIDESYSITNIKIKLMAK